jgi:hypothetical protein
MVSKSVSTADGHAMVRRWIHDNNFTCKTNGLASAVTGDFKGTPKVPKQIAAMMPAVQPQLSPHPSKMDVGIVLFWVDKAAIDVVYSVVVDYFWTSEVLRKVSVSATIHVSFLFWSFNSRPRKNSNGTFLRPIFALPIDSWANVWPSKNEPHRLMTHVDPKSHQNRSTRNIPEPTNADVVKNMEVLAASPSPSCGWIWVGLVVCNDFPSSHQFVLHSSTSRP